MSTFTRCILCTFCLILLSPLVLAQDQQKLERTFATPAVTALSLGASVRFTAPSNIVRLHVEVFSETGESLFDVSSKGNVFDWTLQDGHGQHIADGGFLCVVTVKSLNGKISQRIGNVSVQGGLVTLQAEATRLSTAQQQAVGPVEENAMLTVLPKGDVPSMTVVAHDGRDGQITSTTGALTFRTGDFFAGTEQEQMRITPDGKVGIGTRNPQATLDVAGTIHAAKGIEFADGTVQTTGLSGRKDKDGNFVPTIAGTGTQNKIAKWIDNTGTLGDSTITQDSTGNVGIGIPTPQYPLHITNPAFAQAYVAGGTAADFLLYHTNAPVNTRWFGLRSQDGRGKISSFNDNGTYRIDGILAWDNATGNVGVGTLTPTFKFHLVDAFNTGLRVHTNTAGGTVASFGGNGDFQIDAQGVVGGRFVVKESGRVGIGTNSPKASLDLKGGADADGSSDPSAMAFQYRGGGFRHWIRTRHNSILGSGNAIDFFVNDSTTAEGSSGAGLGSGSAFVMTLDSGRVGIGTTNPSEKLSVEGKIQSTFGGFKFPDSSVQTTAAANATYTISRFGAGTELTSSGFGTVLHLDLPAGTYLLMSSVEFYNGANYFGQDNTRTWACRFSGDNPNNISESHTGALTDLTVSLHSVVTISAGGVDFGCQAYSGNLPRSDVYPQTRRLTAVKLAGSVGVQ